MTRSSSAGLSSMFRLYLKPEHPPGSTAMRSPAVSGDTFSSAMNFLTSTAACSVTVRVMGLVRCVVAIAILQSGANLDSSFGQVNSLPRGHRPYAPDARRLAGHRPVLPVQRRRRPVLQEPRQPEHDGVLSLREKRALVAGRHVDGGHYVRRGHAARRHRPGRAQRRRRELAVVEPLMSGMLTVFFYARLWRRAGVMTDIEFSEIRYAGPPAAFLRGFRAIYLGLLINCIILGWVNLAMAKILQLLFGVSKGEALWIVVGLIVLTSAISTLSGLWGVLVTDLFQFVIKMGMVIVLAVFAVRAVGGIDAMKTKLAALDATRGLQGSVLSFVPDLNSAWMPMITFFVYISLNWWATWYPGAEPGGGGYIAQRMFCAKDEKNSLLATLWFNEAHYAVRPWPWILVALASLILFPGLTDPETGYVRVMIAYLPPSLRGLMVAAFAAAYMSTIATQLNWGASYLVNDFYRRFWKPTAPERHYVTASRIATILLTVISAVVTFYLDSIAGAWKLLLVTGAGTGSVLLLRWYWWRINAWSEVSAMRSGF